MKSRQEVLDFLDIFGRKATNIFSFCEMLGIIPNGAQGRFFKIACALDPEGGWLFRFVIHRAANQVGKTLGVAIADLFAAHNKIGIPHGDPTYLFGVKYIVLHLGPDYGTSRKMLNEDLIPLLMGRHPAQFDKATGQFRKCRYPKEAWESVKFDEGEHPGIKLWNNSELHFRTLDDSASGVSQMTVNLISVDEAALEDKLKEADDLVLRMRVVANRGPRWFIGTPDGPNDFAEMIWDIEAKGTETENRIWVDEPEKRALVWNILQDNVGYGITQEELDFQEATQDPATKEAKLRGAILFPVKAYFTPTENILRTWVPGLRSREIPLAGHKYVIFWDVSVESDPTVMVVIDVTRKPWRGVKYRRWAKPMPVIETIRAMEEEHSFWSDAGVGMVHPRVTTGYDATSMGGAMFGQLMSNIPNKRGVNFAGPKVKDQALADMRAIMSQLGVIWPEDWLTLRKEVMGYRRKDDKIRQDSVMAVAGAIYVALRGDLIYKARPFNTGWHESEGISVG